MLAEKGVTYFRSDQNNFGIKIRQNFQSLGRRIEEKTYRIMACERYAAIGLELGAAAAAHKKYKSGRQREKKESQDRHGYQSRETLNTAPPPPPPSIELGPAHGCDFLKSFQKVTRPSAGLHCQAQTGRRTELDGGPTGGYLPFRTRSHFRSCSTPYARRRKCERLGRSEG